MQQDNIKKYHPVGSRTLLVFIFRSTAVTFFMVPLFIVGLFGLSYVPSQYIDIAVNLITVSFVVLLFILSLSVFVGWLQYFRYWIFVDDKDLKISRGLISTEQIGVPYRHIQDVKITRGLIDQIFGVSDIIITVFGSGHDEGNQSQKSGDDDDIVMMPALSKEIAVEIQGMILKKAQVEQVHVISQQNPM